MSTPETAVPTHKPKQIDPRGPRVAAAFTSILLAVTIVVALTGQNVAALILLAVIVVLFALGAAGSPAYPWSLVFTKLIRPRLVPPAQTEDAAPPRFALLVGLIITGIGLIGGLAGIQLAVPIAAGFAFVAAFLNASIGFCLGCEIYGLIVRIRTASSRN